MGLPASQPVGRLIGLLGVVLIGGALLRAQSTPPPDPAYPSLDRAYQALKAGDLDAAAAAFQQAAQAAPGRPAIHKELAYTYIKMGETEKAVREFEAVQRLAPEDFENALSLAFLYFETRRENQALDMFELAARSSNPETRRTAAETVAGIQRDYEAQIERWQRAVELDPKNASARLELGALYRKNREYKRAIEQYQAVRRLMPHDLQALLELARLCELAQDAASARAFYLLAWRSADPRVSELGRAGLGPSPSYPSPADFQHALDFDPANLKVRRDLAYLYLNLGRPAEAAAEFEKITAQEPGDWQSILQLAFTYVDAGKGEQARPLLERVVKRGNAEQARKATEALLRLREQQGGSDKAPGPGSQAPVREDPETARLRQMARGYAALAANNLPAAAEFFETAYRLDPGFDAVPLQLGWIYNMLRRDDVAVRWFRLAAAGTDAALATEARRAVRNLEPTLRKVVYTFWANPVVSSRWRDLFGYAQWKAELKWKRAVRPYLSLRFNGDLRTRSQAALPLFFSDGGMTLGVGVLVQPRRDFSAWGEVGNTLSYYARPVPGTGRFYPDYRAGATWFRAWGPLLFTDLPGYHRFADVAVANLFISRYSNDLFHYVQGRAGYHLPRSGMLNSQAYLALNYVRDERNLYWANFAEIGPAFAFGFRNFPQMQTSVGLLRGVYTRNQENPRRPNFLDLRVNIWYSRSF